MSYYNTKKTCKYCGKTFYQKKKYQIYCNDECENNYKKEKRLTYHKTKTYEEIKCKACGKTFTPTRPNNVYCSKKCSCAIKKEYYENNYIRGRFIIFERDKFKCAYCGKTSFEDGVKLHVDHIIPIDAGGKTTAENLITSCERCNVEKSNKIINSKELLEEVRKRNNLANISNNIIIKNINHEYRTKYKNIKNKAISETQQS